MGFGASTTVGNVSVDMVQADVAAIIAGIAGETPQTLADLESLLTTIDADTGNLGSINSLCSQIRTRLGSTYDGYALADYFDSTNAYEPLYYSGISIAALLSDIEDDTDYLYSSMAGYGVADELYYYLYDSSNYRGLIDYFNTSNMYEPLFYGGYSLGYMIYQLFMCISGGRLLVTTT